MTHPAVPAAALAAFVREAFTRSGLAEAHAATVADVLVWANLRGIDTHGVIRVPRYLELVALGDMNPRPAIRITRDMPAAVLVDVDRAIGPVAMTEGMKIAIGKAEVAGIGLAVIRRATHTAALGYYTLQAAARNMIGIAMSGSWPNMAYHGAHAAAVSTAPISVAVPGGARGPVLLDMGTGIVSVGKLNQAKRTGQPIPAGWALDKSGQPTTDPATASTPLPMAGPKGSGLALMIEILTGVLGANPILADYLTDVGEKKRHRQNALAIAIDIGRFIDPPAFGAEVERLAGVIKALPRDPAVPEILLPGERGDRAFAARSRDGIPLPPGVRTGLDKVATRLGMPSLESPRA